jgi:hypothetical protein
LEVFPYKSLDSWVLWDGFIQAIAEEIARRWAFNWNVIDIRDCVVRDLWLEDVGDIVVEYRN